MAGTEFTTLAGGLGFTEGPVWLGDDRLAVVSITDGAVIEVRSGAPLRRWELGGGPNGAAVDASGVLYIAQNGGIWGGRPGPPPSVTRIADDTVDHLVTGFDAPNDLCFAPDGRLLVTDSRAECDPNDAESALPGRLFSIDVQSGSADLLFEGPAFINGLAFDPTGTVLYVAETARRRILRLSYADGQVSGDWEVFAELPVGLPDGLAVDAQGSVWVGAIADCVHSFDADGRLERTVMLPEGSIPTNLCFGGSDGRTLFVCASLAGKVLTLPVEVEGLPLHSGIPA